MLKSMKRGLGFNGVSLVAVEGQFLPRMEEDINPRFYNSLN